MTIFIGADHRGFELKNKLIEFLQDQNIRVEDLGNYSFDQEDDYPDYAKKVAQAVLQNIDEFLGILVCGSGAGVSIAANRSSRIRCAVAINEDQVKHVRENDHANILAISSDHTDFETAKKYIEVFLGAKPNQEQKYIRRIKKLDEASIEVKKL